MTNTKLSTNRRRSNKKLGILLVIIIATCAAGGTVFALSVSNNPETETAEEAAYEPELTVSDDDDEEQTLSDEDAASSSLGEVKQNEGEDPNTLADLTGSLNYAEPSGDNLVIRVTIDQNLYSGTCRLTLTGENGAAYTAEAPIFSTGSAYASCEGFDIPLSELSASSSWSISIELVSGDKTGLITGDVKL